MSRTVVAALVACALSGAVACGSSKPKVVAPPPPTILRGQTAVEIDADGYQFTPANIVVDVGTRVTWRNKDPVAHNVEKSADALDFGAPFGVDASRFNPGESYTFTFAKAGKFFYTCTIHTAMSGEVQVVAK